MKVFDSATSLSDFGLSAGPLWYRMSGDSTFTRGVGELRLGAGIHTNSPFVSTGGVRELALRALGDSTFSASFIHHAVSRLKLPLLEPQVFFGFSMATIDNVDHKFSFGFFSPRVGLSMGLRLGAVRVGLAAQSEYQWRWLGRNLILHGLLVELSWVTPNSVRRAVPRSSND